MLPINIHSVIQRVQVLLQFNNELVQPITPEEEELAQHLKELVTSNCSIETYENLVPDDDNLCEDYLGTADTYDDSHDSGFLESDLDAEASDDQQPKKKMKAWSSEFDEPPGESVTHYRPSLTEKKKIVNLLDRKWSLRSIQSKYRRVKSLRVVRLWRLQINSSNKSSKIIMKDLNKKVYVRFLEAYNSKHTIHGVIIRSWAMKIAKDMGCMQFKASQSWLDQWKRSFGIVNRKITKFVASGQEQDDESKKKAAEEFSTAMRAKIQEIGEDHFYNADHTMIIKELRAKRSLHFKGAKIVTKIAQNLSATTHSHTLVPFVSCSGKTMEKALLILQENTGFNFGPRVAKTLFRPANLHIISSKSGKQHGFQVDDMLDSCFFPEIQSGAHILLDQWSGFKNLDTSDLEIKWDKEVVIEDIPAGCTSMIQPLDVSWNLFFKEMQRKLTEKIIIEGIKFSVSKRNNTIKIVSFVFHQMSSPRYINLVKYAWFKSGYTSERPGHFLNPSAFAFSLTYKTCERANCKKSSFLRCGWCAKFMCFSHLFVSTFHLCSDYIEL